MSRSTGPARPALRFRAASTATSLTLNMFFRSRPHTVRHHLVEDGGQVGVVLGGDLIEDAKHGESVRHTKVVSRWGAVNVVLCVDVDQVDLEGVLLPVQGVLGPPRTVCTPMPMQLQEVKSDKWIKSCTLKHGERTHCNFLNKVLQQSVPFLLQIHKYISFFQMLPCSIGVNGTKKQRKKHM